MHSLVVSQPCHSNRILVVARNLTMENVNIRQLPCNDPSVPCNDYGLGVCNYTTAVCNRVVPSLSSAPADQRPNWTACNVVPAPAPALPPRRALGSRPHAFKPDDDQSQ